MADFTALKTAIQNAIKQNGNEEITGNILQDVLLAIVSTLGDGSINDLITALGTEATTRSQADGTLQQNINAEATTRGQADTALGVRIDGVIESINSINAAIGNGYVYAGIATPSSTPTTGKVFYLALTAGTYTNFGNIAVTQGINILKYDGADWSLDVIASIDDAPTPSSNNLVKSGGVFNDIMTNGSAFDLTAYNNGTTYADLNAALTALNALPAAYKERGMSMKYVQTSDNKYVQVRLMAQNFTTDVTQWQGVDVTPTKNSKNLITSGAVSVVNDEVFGVEGNAVAGYYINSSKAIVAGEGFGVTGYIDVPAGDFQVYYSSGSLTGKYLVFYNDNDETVGSAEQLNNVGGKTVSIPTGATKFRFSFDLSYDNVRCAYQTNVFYRPIIHTEGLGTKIIENKEYADTIKDSLDSLKADGYVYAGIAGPASSISATNRVFCLAWRVGTYTNFGNISVAEGEIALLKYNGSAWSKETISSIRSAGVYINNLEYNKIFKEIYVSPDITWSNIYVRVIDEDTTHWSFVFAKDSSASEYKRISVLKSSVDNIISIENKILFSVREEYLFTTTLLEGNARAMRNPYFSPTCYACYLSTKLSNDIDVVDKKIVGQDGNYTSGLYITSNAKMSSDDDFAVSDFINVPAGSFQVYYSEGGLAGKYLIFYNNNYVKVGDAVQLNNVGGKTVDIPSGATKFRFSFDLSYYNVRCAYLANVFYRPSKEIQNLRIAVEGVKANCKDGYYIDSHHDDVSNINYSISDFINVTGGTNISVYYSNQNEPGTFLNGYDSSGTIVQQTQMNGGSGAIAVSLESSVVKIRFSFNRFYPNVRVAASGVTIYTPVYGVDSIEKKSNDYTDAQISSLRVRGNDPLMFTLIDDDFTNITMCDKLRTLCDSLGIKCTFALLPEYANNDPYTPSLPTATLEKIQEFQEDGFSFAMHPNHHLFYMDEGSGVVTECEKCLVRLKQFFDENHILGGSRILVWPGDSDTQNNQRLLPIAKRNVDIAVHAGLYGGQFYNTAVRFASSRYQLRRMPLDFGFYTKTQMKAKIDEFVASGGGLMIFISHVWQFVNDESTVDETTPSWANFAEVLTYAANKNIQFVNMNEVMYRKIEPEYMPSIKMVQV